jgi:hypothetical protein
MPILLQEKKVDRFWEYIHIWLTDTWMCKLAAQFLFWECMNRNFLAVYDAKMQH